MGMSPFPETNHVYVNQGESGPQRLKPQFQLSFLPQR